MLNGKPVGIATLVVSKRFGLVTNIAVLQEHRGKELSLIGISATTATILAPFIAGLVDFLLQLRRAVFPRLRPAFHCNCSAVFHERQLQNPPSKPEKRFFKST